MLRNFLITLTLMLQITCWAEVFRAEGYVMNVHPFGGALVMRYTNPEETSAEMWNIDFTTHQERLLTHVPSAYYPSHDYEMQCCVAPNGAFVAFNSSRGDLYVCSLDENTSPSLLWKDSTRQEFDCLDVSADSNFIVWFEPDYAEDALTLWAHDMRTGVRRKLADGINDTSSAIFEISPDSSQVLFQEDSQLYLIPINGGTPVPLPSPVQDHFYPVSFHFLVSGQVYALGEVWRGNAYVGTALAIYSSNGLLLHMKNGTPIYSDQVQRLEEGLLYPCSDGMRFFDVDSSTDTLVVPMPAPYSPAAHMFNVVYNPSSGKCFFGLSLADQENSPLYCYSPDGSTQQLLGDNHTTEGYSYLCITKDGRYFLSPASEGSATSYYVTDTVSGVIHKIAPAAGYNIRSWRLADGPDHLMALTLKKGESDYIYGIYNLVSRSFTSIEAWTGNEGAGIYSAVSPDGHWTVYRRLAKISYAAVNPQRNAVHTDWSQLE